MSATFGCVLLVVMLFLAIAFSVQFPVSLRLSRVMKRKTSINDYVRRQKSGTPTFAQIWWIPILIALGLTLTQIPVGPQLLGRLYLFLDRLFSFAAPAFGFWLFLVAAPRRTQALKRSVTAADRRICPHCLYSLVGSPDAGDCPECGTPYEIEDVRNYWAEMIVVHDQLWRRSPLGWLRPPPDATRHADAPPEA